jgi:hypothetical protein
VKKDEREGEKRKNTQANLSDVRQREGMLNVSNKISAFLSLSLGSERAFYSEEQTKSGK